ncbi:unnamed protein product [Polarella glacialis]|uniref:Uncharacterized protein n=2 Tax=Polarella glacialis TaxID=89957 RepID=A0A813HAM4_POLGL|nr:unnamed protein product [Polarella glacialis]
MFTLVFGVMSFKLHYAQPTLCYLILAACLVAVMCVAFTALGNRTRLFSSASEREPSWLIFIAACLFFALISGFTFGQENYTAYSERFYNLQNLNNYTNVYPNLMLGQQLIDAGVVQFAEGTRLEVGKSMGFKNSKVFCVAPIVFGDKTPLSYDFWAVGEDCCSGSQADYHCGAYNNPLADGAIRLMASEDRSFYRLAVQQAEATYNIKAAHPLFFTWSVQPSATIKGWETTAQGQYVVCMMSFLVFQIFLVALATVVFSKIGYY